MRDISDAIADHTGLSRRVLEYSAVMKQLVDAAKQPRFSEASWAPLAAFVATDVFERVGNFKEVMRWPDYIAFLTQWAMHSEWEGSFKRVTEAPGLVLLELEERSAVGGYKSVVNSVSVYVFNDAGKITHLDIYLQMELPDPAMLQGYEGVRISA
ncbi:hypothetical protein [Acidocella sp.]|uniref:hypothetical protein n=1 Tax=Acidocella sp. TaxID=50710 RepID=UPI00262C7900|nr:hypothetical protein [Acidocella sp.]